jgi:5-methylcytosine-specific restriction endonuclease McrA
MAGHVISQLPWWLWPLIGVVLIGSAFEQEQRQRRKASHRAYLRSSEWKVKRRDALSRAGGRCEHCGRSTNLHVHHLTYNRHGNELARDLRVLCASCHRRRHRDGGRIDDNIDRLVGWMSSRNSRT